MVPVVVVAREYGDRSQIADQEQLRDTDQAMRMYGDKQVRGGALQAAAIITNALKRRSATPSTRTPDEVSLLDLCSANQKIV